MLTDTATIQIKNAPREQLEGLVTEFLAAGGQINRLSHTERAPRRPCRWNVGIVRSKESRLREAQARAALEAAVHALCRVETPFGPVLRTAAEIRLELKKQGRRHSLEQIEQTAARLGLTLRDTGRSRKA